jgi:hypothetical protein
MSLRVYYEVLNQKGSPALFTDTLANRPAFGFQGRLFISTDTAQIFEDTGSAWTLIADATGSVIGFVPYSGAINDLNLGSFDLTADIGILNQVKAVGSGGLSINANSGTQIAVLGAGGGANMTLLGGLSGTSATLSNKITINSTIDEVLRLNTTSTFTRISFCNNDIIKALSYYNSNTNELVYGTYSSGGAIRFETDNNVTALSINASQNATFVGSVTASSLIKNGGTSAQILAADGSVITAGTNITISGGIISASGGGGGMAIGGSITSATAGSVLFVGSGGVLAQDNTGLFYNVANDRLGIGSTTLGSNLQINGNAAIGYSASTAAPNNGLAVSGSVGIGTISPLSALQVSAIPSTNGDSVYQIIAFDTNTATSRVGAGISFGGYYNGTTDFSSAFASIKGFKENATNNDFAGAMSFQTRVNAGASTERMRITSGGNVLIGTTTDSGQGKLQINGGLTASAISVTGATYTVSATLSQQYYHVFNGSTGQTLTLPTPLNNNYQYVVINNTANTVTLAAATSTNIITTTGTSVANITLIANQRVFIIADGNNKYYQIF